MTEAGLAVPVLAVLPFALLLLAIAVLPLVMEHRWEHHRTKALVVALVACPILGWLLWASPAHLVSTLHEYVSFVCLLGALFVIAGGIHLRGDLLATPRNNTILLLVGAVLANLVGTTGASMVLIRLLLRTNADRKHTAHLPFFFLLIVSNAGGLLTPLGDPPLFLGYLRGVPFFFTLRLFPIWLGVIGYLLAANFVLDRRAYARESSASLLCDRSHVQPLRLEGWLNVPLLLGVVGAVFLPSPWREMGMVALALLSLRFGPKRAREKNEFAFAPIIEVAILFLGIFITMVPALELLYHHGAALGLRHPWQFFLTSGALSSVLDNAPTYLTFLSSAQGLGLAGEVVGIPARFLIAISAGSVLMGANTYIGNGPNFMVKAIADRSGYRMPSFARYAAMAILVLSPCYLAISAWLAWG